MGLSSLVELEEVEAAFSQATQQITVIFFPQLFVAEECSLFFASLLRSLLEGVEVA